MNLADRHRPEESFWTIHYVWIFPIEAVDLAFLVSNIDRLNLSVRATNALYYGRPRVETIAQLIQRSGNDLLDLDNLGSVTLEEIRDALSRYGLRLRLE
jgi:DNA-directed RNA polymerase alpha subunit